MKATSACFFLRWWSRRRLRGQGASAESRLAGTGMAGRYYSLQLAERSCDYDVPVAGAVGLLGRRFLVFRSRRQER